MNKNVLWIMVLGVMSMGLMACTATTDGGAYPVENSAADGTMPVVEDALQPVEENGTSAETLSPYPSAPSYPGEADFIEDPVIIEAGEDLEMIELPEDSNMPDNFLPESASPLLKTIVQDAFERGDAKTDKVNVIKFEETTWPDGSMGCPEEGMMYTQALVPGYWVVVQIEGKIYDYRASQSGNFRLCNDPVVLKSPPASPDN